MVRPPLVGQASSSSNESRQSLSSGTEDIQEDINISPFSRNTCERFSEPIVNTRDYFIDNPNSQISHYLSNREDYISAKPPEGSSDHSLVSINTAEPPDGNPRIPSPASSVTSVRPLEWDSGADVGYQQNYLQSVQRLDPLLSTIERLAIGTTALLTRSDPEGTTEPSVQPVAKTIVKLKNSTVETDTAGLPKAQSTPFSTFMPSNENIIGSRDVFSPIAQLNSHNCSPRQQSSDYEKGPGSSKHTKKTDSKYSLFPELKNCNNVKIQDSKFTEKSPNLIDDHKIFKEPVDFNIKNFISKSSSLKSSACSSQTNSPKKNPNSPGKSSQSTVETETGLNNLKHSEVYECYFGNTNKKLSSSLEDIRDLKNVVVGSVARRNTLPRSQSQTNILLDKDKAVCSNDKVKYQSTNMAIHNFPCTTNKSASSSSVATVVQKKNDSPLHYPKLVQTSLLKQSIGIQASEHNVFDVKPSKCLVANETRSNYFIQKLSSDQNQDSNDKENVEVNLECHKGFICKGAHKKVSAGNESYEMLPRMSSDIKPSQNNSVFQVSENIKYQESTLDSIESSSKSRGFSTDIQGSMAAEDRVNSFEYLPGYVYENEKQISSHSTSSVSAAHKNSGHIENLWETDRSSNLIRDINRGVEIIKDVGNNNPNDIEMKKRVIQLVVEKLINTKYEDDYKSVLNENVPWVPPILENRNDMKFKKQDKTKVPGELSSLTDSSRGTSNTSSECFKPKPSSILRDIGTSKLQFIDKCIGTGESLTSTSPKACMSSQTITSIDSTDAIKPKVLSGAKAMSYMIKESKEYLLDSSSTSSPKYDKKNWREPVTKAEQIYEQRRKLQKQKMKENIESKKVIQFLDLEKKTQLMRIDIEMQHLNNLQKLLSKTEELKENMKDLKRTRAHILKQSKEENDTKQNTKFPTRPSMSVHHRMTPSSPSKRKISSKQYNPNFYSWMNKAKTVPEQTCYTEAIIKPQEIKNDWSSHHYFSEGPESDKTNQEVKSSLFNYETRQRYGQRTASVSSALKAAMLRQGQTEPSKRYNKITDAETNKEDSTECANILRRRNLQNDLVHSVGVQTLEQKTSGKDEKLNDCECHKICGCCKENRCCRKQKGSKQGIGYYITFQPQSDSDQKLSEKPSPEEVRINVPTESSKTTVEREKAISSSSESDVIVQHHKPTLQDYLEGNRPDYIHRANDRKQCIAQLAYLRELRDQSKRRLLALSQPTVSRELPPPPLAMKRIFSQKKMRQQTERKYKQLAEVQNKQQDTKRKEAYRTNRLMAEVFTKKLQRRVLKGETNLSNSISIISSL